MTWARPRPTAFWRSFLRSLRARGLDRDPPGHLRRPHRPGRGHRQGVGLPVAALHVHFLRDMLGHVARACPPPLVSGAIRGIFTAGSAVEARQRLGQVVDQLRPHAPVARLLEDAELMLAFYGFRDEHGSKLRSTNPLERVTARSAGARMWWGSSPMTPRCCGWPGCCCWSRLMSGWSAAATCQRPPWPWSWRTPPLNPTTPTPGGPRAHLIMTTGNPTTITSYTTKCDLTPPTVGLTRDWWLVEGQASHETTSVRVISGSPPCRPAFPQVGPDRQGRG